MNFSLVRRNFRTQRNILWRNISVYHHIGQRFSGGTRDTGSTYSSMLYEQSFSKKKSFQLVTFQSDILHPLIDPLTGRLQTSEAFPSWNANDNHVWQILKFILFVFEYSHVCFSGDIVNKEAVDLMAQSKSEFTKRIKECVRISRDRIYEPPSTEDKHYITFDRFDNDIHGSTLESIKSKKYATSSPPNSSLSWYWKCQFHRSVT